MQINQLTVRSIVKQEEKKYLQLMDEYYYLGSIPKIGETIWLL